MQPRGLFYTYHPAICMLFFIAAICFAFCSMQPAYVVMSVVMSCAYLTFLKGFRAVGRRLLLFIPFTAFIALLNSLFNSAGATTLFEWGGVIQITLEGVVYGICAAGMLIAVLMWFSCYNEIMTEDKFTYLFGRALPSLSLMISMISRWVPTMIARGRTIYDSQEALIGGQDRRGKIARCVRMATVLVGLGMEDSIQTSDSMRARGYGTARRTSYARYSWHGRETAALVVLIALAALNVVFMYVATSAFEFYPTMSELPLWWGYIPYAVMLALPLMVEIEEIGK